jgi:hypothetical protein
VSMLVRRYVVEGKRFENESKIEATRSCLSLDRTSGTLRTSESVGNNGPGNKKGHWDNLMVNLNIDFRGSWELSPAQDYSFRGMCCLHLQGRITQCQIPEDCKLNTQCYENLRCHIAVAHLWYHLSIHQLRPKENPQNPWTEDFRTF